MAQILLLKIAADGVPLEMDSAADDITLNSFSIQGGGPVLSGTGLDANNQDVSDVKDLIFNDPTAGTINQTAGALIVDDIMAKERENTMTIAGGIAFPVIADNAGEVDAFRLPAIAGVPTAAPTNGGEGHVVWDSTGNRMFAWDGSAWDDLSTVQSAESILNPYTAGVAIAANEAVYISAADTVSLALANNTSQSYMVGFAKAAASLGNPVDIQSEGVMAGFTGLTAGSRYYLDDATAGAITSTIPSGSGKTIVQVGYARAATKMHIHIEQMGRRA